MGKLAIRSYHMSQVIYDTDAQNEVCRVKLGAYTVNETRINNARRLVACWNACLNVTTDELERVESAAVMSPGTLVMSPTPIDPAADRDRLRDECWRLKEAITQIESEFAPGDARKLYASPDDALHRIRNIARAALRPADAKEAQS